jgi:hypothetical protein
MYKVITKLCVAGKLAVDQFKQISSNLLNINFAVFL